MDINYSLESKYGESNTVNFSEHILDMAYGLLGNKNDSSVSWVFSLLSYTSTELINIKELSSRFFEASIKLLIIFIFFCIELKESSFERVIEAAKITSNVFSLNPNVSIA